MIIPSILNADNMNLAFNIKQAIDAGIIRFHIDIMDGHFVPNLSYGPQLVSDFHKEFPAIDTEVHLMSDNLKVTVPAFVDAGCNLLEFHYEACDPQDIKIWMEFLKTHGVERGLVLNPDTDVEALEQYVDYVDQVLLMTVYPGFGGQKFISESLERIKKVREILDKHGKKSVPIEVDGGINDQTAKIAKEAGAENFVVGSYIFEQGTIFDQISKLKEL